MTDIDHKRLAKELDRRRMRRRLVMLLGGLAAAIAAALYLKCGGGWGTGGKGPGEGGVKGVAAIPKDATSRCAVRLAASGLTVDGKPATRNQVVAICKRTTGADVLITGDARQGDWDDLRAALEAASIPFFTREPRGVAPTDAGRQLMATPLEGRELAHLLTRLEEGVNETAGRFKVQMTLVFLLFLLMGIGMGVKGSWAVAAFIIAFGFFILWIGYKASTKNAPEKMRPVLDAVRDKPETVRAVRHTTTSDTRRIFVTHWVTVATETHHLLLKAPDWADLVPLLQRRCPKAELVDKT